MRWGWTSGSTRARLQAKSAPGKFWKPAVQKALKQRRQAVLETSGLTITMLRHAFPQQQAVAASL
jgi:hypothetical protein